MSRHDLLEDEKAVQRVALFLAERDEALEPGEATHMERTASARLILELIVEGEVS